MKESDKISQFMKRAGRESGFSLPFYGNREKTIDNITDGR